MGLPLAAAGVRDRFKLQPAAREQQLATSSTFLQPAAFCSPANPCPPSSPLPRQVECAYHGWRFNGSGDCTVMPSTVHCRGVAVSALPCVEKDGFVWVWPGEEEPGEVGAFFCGSIRWSAACALRLAAILQQPPLPIAGFPSVADSLLVTPPQVPRTTLPPPGYDIHAEIAIDVPVEHGEWELAALEVEAGP